MDHIVLELDTREVTGKAVKQLRAAGIVPAVIHDHGKESIVVSGQYLELVKAFKRAGKHHPIQVQANGKQYTTLIKAAEFDPKKHELRHVVFNAVKANEKVTAEVPVRITFSEDNEATPAERAGLVVLHQLDSVEVEAVPSKLPEVIEFSGEELVEVGDHVTVADLQAPAGVTITADPAHPIATVFEPAALQAANDAAAGTADDEAATQEEGEATADEAPGSSAESADAAATADKKE